LKVGGDQRLIKMHIAHPLTGSTNIYRKYSPQQIGQFEIMTTNPLY